jgi:D-3-phosphoglycerate dehydrogenase
MYSVKKLNSISNVIYDYLPKDRYSISSDLASFDAIIVRSADCHEIEFPDGLLAIARAGAGVNNIPLDKSSELGIAVFNTPGANANGVKELVLCGMLAASRNMIPAIEWAKTLQGCGADVPVLVEKGKSQFVGPELRGKTLGVVGLGAIGILVANTAAAIGMEVIGYDPFLSVDRAWSISMHTRRANSLEELLSQSDYITLHIPLMDKTKDFISSHEFSKMKKGMVLLNFSRNGLVKHSSLFEAIENGTLDKYVTDFPVEELLGHEKIIAIPHLGASTPESEDNCAMMAAEQLSDYLETGAIRNSVNLPDCQVSPLNGGYRITLIHKNLPNMVGQITNIVAKNNINISDMINKSKGEIAYTVLNTDDPIGDDVFEEIRNIVGIIKVRRIG